MFEDNDNDLCKVVLIGESGVGKTSIISRFMEKTFEYNIPSTIGANYSGTILNIEGKRAKFTIWDTAGQERYRSLTKLFYKDASAAILVYDITNQKSFIELKDYWSKQIKENSSKGIITVIAANKSDLYEDEKIDEAEARTFSEEIGAIFKRTSALNAEGIERLFIDIGYLHYKTLQPTCIRNEEPQNIKINDKKHKEKATNKKKWC